MINIDLTPMGLLNGNVYNFIILVGLLSLLLIKLDVASVLENAKNKILEQIDKSDTDKLLSEKNLEDAKLEVENLPLELEKIKNDAQNTIEAYKKNVQTELENVEQKLENNAQKIINNEILRINIEIQKELATEAVELAHQKTLSNLQNDIQLHRKFINEAIDKIEEVKI